MTKATITTSIKLWSLNICILATTILIGLLEPEMTIFGKYERVKYQVIA